MRATKRAAAVQLSWQVDAYFVLTSIATLAGVWQVLHGAGGGLVIGGLSLHLLGLCGCGLIEPERLAKAGEILRRLIHSRE
jgi:hypothetical protein